MALRWWMNAARSDSQSLRGVGLAVWLAGSLLWLSGVSYLCLTPLTELSLDFSYSDKLGHFGIFAVAGFWLALGRWNSLVMCVGLLLLLGVGALIEALQAQLPFRSAELADWLADGVGAMAGYGFFLVVIRLLGSRR